MTSAFHPRRHWLQTLCASALLLASWTAQAQNWPDKPIRLIVPAPAGGGLDYAARVLGERITAQLGQPIVIDNNRARQV